MKTPLLIVLALLAILLLAGCSAAPTPQPVAALPPTPEPTYTPPPTATATATPTLTLTPTATATPSPTATATPTATPTATLLPVAILAMRQTPYPGSEITIVGEFSPGSNYRRYDITYLSEGLKIYGVLTIPNAAPPEGGWPAIVFNHGHIPPAEYVTGSRYVAYVNRFAANGYVVLMSDYRGHGRSEGEALGAYGTPGYVTDVLNAIGALRQHPLVDENRIGMWGHSMGGYITLRAMVIDPTIKAGVIWAGVVGDYPAILTRWARPRPTGTVIPTAAISPTPLPPAMDWRAWLRDYGTPDENPAFWNTIATDAFFTDLSGPLQLHHGTSDTSVPFEWSERLYTRLTDMGHPVEFYVYEGDDHNLSGSLSLALNRSLEFFDAHVKAAAPLTPAP